MLLITKLIEELANTLRVQEEDQLTINAGLVARWKE